MGLIVRLNEIKGGDVCMKFLESIVNMKLNSIRSGELLQMARQYGITLTPQEAEAIAQKLRGKNYNIFDINQRKNVITQIATVVGPNRAAQIEQVFLSMTGR